MASIRIRSAAELEDQTRAAFELQRDLVLVLVPGAEVEHVGSTAVPGALTKGDLDLLVRVDPAAFPTAVGMLSSHYAVHQPKNWTRTLASFKDPSSHQPEVGIQLVVAGSPDDRLFGPFRDALIHDPALLTEYNELKRRLDGADYERYTEQKGQFVEGVLREINGPID
jgi:GrpB-like predicted nucleotidyltransferase (UPF0157 family)